MIPILYDSSETEFENNGIGRLSDCISCTVTEERNGIYECEFEYPITGVHYKDIAEGRYISVTHDDNGDRQPFKIYHKSAPLRGVVTFNAHHKSYELSNVILSPFEANSVSAAFAKFETNLMTESEFTFWTDKATSGHFAVEVPTSIRSVLGGTEGSILDAFGGGDYEFDGTLVRLWQNRGNDNGVEIRYGKNMSGMVHDVDTLGLYNAVIGYYYDSDGNKVIGDIVYGAGGISVRDYWTNHADIVINDENGNGIEFLNTINQVVPVDLTDKFDEIPTKQQVNDAAQTFLNSGQPWIPKENIRVNFVSLWQTEEYADIAPLERVRLCDEVLVSYPELGVNSVKMKVIRTVFNVLLDKYDALELGIARASFAEVINEETVEKIEKSNNMMEVAIANATKLITGGLGGHVVFSMNAEGKPEEILIMDTENKATAVQVLRINLNGIGFSSTGINGPYRTAWTLDGNFVADFITAGTMLANRIHGGTLTLGGSGNGNGTMVVYDADGNLVTEINNLGTLLKYGEMLASCGLFNSAYYTQVQGVTLAKMNSFAVRSQTDGVTDTVHSFNEYSGVPQQCIVTNKASYQRIVCVGITDADLDQQITSHDNTTDLVETVADNEYNLDLWGHGAGSPSTHFKIASDEISIRGAVGGMVLDSSGVIIEDSRGGDFLNSSGTLVVAGTCKVRAGATLDVYSDVLIKDSSGNNVFWYRPSYDSTRIKMGQKEFDNSTSTNSTTGVVTYFVRYAGKKLAFESSSSKRYKENIADISDDALDPERLYSLPVRQFDYKKDAPLQYGDLYGQTIAGFIAEEVDEIYPSAVIRNEDDSPESWDERRIVPPMLALIQEQKKRIEELEKRVEKLEKAMEILLREEI